MLIDERKNDEKKVLHACFTKRDDLSGAGNTRPVIVSPLDFKTLRKHYLERRPLMLRAFNIKLPNQAQLDKDYAEKLAERYQFLMQQHSEDKKAQKEIVQLTKEMSRLGIDK